MADLDSLQIRISASTREAIGAIDNLITKFGALNNALNNFKPGTDYINGLENLISGMRNLAAAVNSVDPTRMKDITKALGGMTSVGEKMSKLSGIRVVGKDLGNVSTASQRATEEAKKFGKAWGVVDDEGIAELAKEFDHLYASIGNEQEMRSAAQNMEGLVKKFGSFTNEMSEDARTMLRDIQQTFVKLPQDWQNNLIMPTVNGQKMSPEQMRGYVGIKTSATHRAGSTVESIQENPSWGIDTTGMDDYQAAQALFERIAELLGLITEETRTWNELSRDSQSAELETMRAHIEAIVSGLDKGVETARLFNETVSQADDDFMNIDEEDVYEASNMAQATENLAGSLAQVEQYTNAFDPIIQALYQLKDASLPESLSNLQYLKDAISKIGGTAGANAGAQLSQIAEGIRSFEGVTIPNFGENLPNLARGLRSLGSGNIVTASQVLPFVADGLRQLNGVTVTADAEAIANLAHAVSRFGLANITKAVTNIPPLAQSLRELMQTLSTAPQVNTNTVRLVEALSNLNVRSLNTSGGVDRLSGSLRRYRGHARNAQKATKSLASVIGKVYATYWLLFRGIQKFGKAIDLASQLKEVQNVVDVTFGEMSDKMEDFSKKAVDTLGMSELTAKQIGSKYQAMGTAMGITKDMVRETNAFVQTATDGYADVANSMGDISINLTRLAGDMASFYNMDYEEVGEKLQAVFTGQTRPMRAFGVDLTQASLQAFALAHGLDADVKSMTQAEKTLLRYQYVMANTVAAQGDFIRTQDTWANTTKVATERIKQLGIVLGQIGIYTFKPLVQNFNKAMESIIKNATATLNALGKIFGWQVEWSDGGVLRDEEDAAEDLADDMGDAADNAKKFKNFLLGIDELNLLPDNNDKNKGDGSGLGDLLGDYDMNNGLKIKPIESGFESLYDTLFKLGKRINEVIKDLLKNLDWDYIYEKARMFGKGLADFLNGYLSDAELFYEKGRFLANGINTIANALDAFFKRFDGWQLGVDFGSMVNGFTENLDWAVIKSAAYEMAHDIAQAINGAFLTIDWKGVGKTIAEGMNTAVLFLYTLGDEINWRVIGNSLANGINGLFKNFDFAKLAQTINKWAKGLLTLIGTAIKKTDWKQVGEGIGTFIRNLDLLEIAGNLATVLGSAFNAAIDLFGSTFKTAPLETILATTFGIAMSSNRVKKGISTALKGVLPAVGRMLSSDFQQVGLNFGYSINAGLAKYAQSGSFGQSILSGIKQFFDNGGISGQLSVGTKAIGSLGVGIAEFKGVYDSFYELQKGVDNVGEAVAGLVGKVGLAGAAFTALLGFPTGLIATGCVAAVGAIAGINQAIDDLREETILGSLTKDLGENATTLSELTGNFKAIADNITTGLDGLHSQHETLSTAKDEMAGLAGGFELLADAVNSGQTITSGALDELVGDIDNVKKAWEDYVDSQYDYLIMAVRNDYEFAKANGLLTDEMAEDYINRINAYTEARDKDKAAISAYTEELRTARTALQRMEAAHVPVEVLDAQSQKIRDIAWNMLTYETQFGDSIKSVSDELDESLESFANFDLDNIIVSFSDLNADNYGDFVAAIDGYNDSLLETYTSHKDEIDKAAKEMLDAGRDKKLVDDFVTQRTQMLNDAYRKILDAEQVALYDKTYDFLYEDTNLAEDYYDNVIDKVMPKITEGWVKATGEQEAPLREAVRGFMEKAWNLTSEELAAGKWETHNEGAFIRSDWRDIFWSQRDESFTTKLKKQGEDDVNAYVEGVTKGAKGKEDYISSTMRTQYTRNSGSGVLGTNALKAPQVAMLNTTIAETVGLTDDLNKNTENLNLEEAATKGTVAYGGYSTAVQTATTNTAALSQENSTAMQAISKNTSGMQSAIGNVFGSMKGSMSTFMSDYTKTVEGKFSAGHWTSMMSGIPKAFEMVWKQAISAIKSVWNPFARQINSKMKIQIPSVELPNGQKTSSTNIQVKVPEFSTGGFPEDGLFFANHTEMVGQFSNGKTAVANNEQITAGIEAAVYRAMSNVMSSYGGQNVNVELAGDAATFFTAMVKENNNYVMRTGASPMRI